MSDYTDLERKAETQKKYNQARKVLFREYMNELKDNPCADCGIVFHPVAMDFDHVRGQKTMNVSQMVNYSEERLEAELAKCELVCSNCHRIRTFKRLQGANR